MTNIDYSALYTSVTTKDIRALKSYTQYKPNETSLADIFSYLILGMIWLYFAVVAALDKQLTGVTILTLIILVSLGIALISKYQSLRKLVRLYKFSLANGLTFQNNIRATQPGIIFTSGTNNDNRIVKQVSSREFSVGTTTFSSGSGKNRRKYSYDYAIIDLTKNLPNIILDAKANDVFGVVSDMPELPSSNQKTSLEGNFNDFFTVYSPNTYDVDVRVVLTPDVMATLIDKAAGYNVEFIDHYAILFTKSVPDGDLKFIERLLTSAVSVSNEIQLQAKHYSDARINPGQVGEVAGQGRRLKFNAPLYVKITVGIILIYYIFSIIISTINALK